MRAITAFALLWLLAAAPASAADGKPQSVARSLLADIERHAQASGGSVGVAAWRTDGTGAPVLVNADVAFPMASTFKIAVAAAVFARIDAGQGTLQQIVEVRPEDRVPSDIIAERLVHSGVALSVHNLLELMLTESDNTATDVLTRYAGGPQAVQAWLDRQGIAGQRIDRDTGALLRDFFELPPGPFHEVLEKAVARDPQLVERGTRPNPRFDADPRDTSTPRAMTELLAKLHSGRVLSAASTRELIAIMQRCRTGAARLKGKLPEGSVVAHKTGTIGGTVNDVGLIELPEGAGTIAISVFVKQSAAPMAERERAIAEIARSVRDYYLFAAPRIESGSKP